MIKEFLICLAVFDLYFEKNLNTIKGFDFLDLKRLNPYYWKIRKIYKRRYV